MKKSKKYNMVTYSFHDDVPLLELKEKVIYVIGENNYFWLIIFKCPCGCGNKIQLNLLKNVQPSWRFFIRKKVITISPSVWRQTGCQSHFIIKKSKIIFVRDWHSRAANELISI